MRYLLHAILRIYTIIRDATFGLHDRPRKRNIVDEIADQEDWLD